MPRSSTAVFPLTPISSSDLKAQDGTHRLTSLQSSFELHLPEPALVSSPPPPPLSTPEQQQQQHRQPAETVKARKRKVNAASAACRNDANVTVEGESFVPLVLPPPPTRSRRIIQMNPPPAPLSGGNDRLAAAAAVTPGKGKSRGKGAADSVAAAAATEGSGGAKQGTKRKAPSSTSVAGRKIARKTAHSLIERRRRSKMNEEFATLKSMVPACDSGDMHKLTILQAAIDYLRYLQDCVDKLQTERKEFIKPPCPLQHGTSTQPQLPSIREAFREPEPNNAAEFCPPPPPPSSVSQPPSPALFTPTSPSAITKHQQRYHPSPALTALQEEDARRGSQTSVSTATSGHYRCVGPSPALVSQYEGRQGMGVLTTPPLGPKSDLDHEATAALLMLNSDRRGLGMKNGRGLSVGDLLSE